MNLMNATDYLEFVKSLAKPLLTPQARYDHACLGIIGEIGEVADVFKKYFIYEQDFDREHAIEELGDLLFYISMLVNEGYLVRVMPGYPQVVPIKCIWKMAQAAAALTEDAVESRDLELCKLVAYFNQFRENFGISREEVILANVAKLTKRYPNAEYTNAHAKERLDKIND